MAAWCDGAGRRRRVRSMTGLVVFLLSLALSGAHLARCPHSGSLAGNGADVDRHADHAGAAANRTSHGPDAGTAQDPSRMPCRCLGECYATAAPASDPVSPPLRWTAVEADGGLSGGTFLHVVALVAFTLPFPIGPPRSRRSIR